MGEQVEIVFSPKVILTLISLEFSLKGHQSNKGHLNRCVVTHGKSKERKAIEILQGQLSTIYLGRPEQACGHSTADTMSE